MADDRVKLEASWKEALGEEFGKPYMKQLREFLQREKQAGKRIYPPGSRIFAALDATPLPDVKVVIIGQDPYHGTGQAHGLCFSVPPGVAAPPSLINIFQELGEEFAEERRGFQGACLESWAAQGVLLLNAVLTVEAGRAASHQGKGWEQFTDRVVEILNAQRSGLVFLLWGSYAQKKGAMVDRSRHCVLSAPHPSPLSAHRGFFGCGHFARTNAYLTEQGADPIDWFALA
tara:strand:- start:2321 stop:3013 length:693 start_codon:yes stop_codon:yes gene_type:complete